MTTPHIPHPGGGRDREPQPYTDPGYSQPAGVAFDMNVKAKNNRTTKIVGGIIAGVLALCCGGVIVAVANGDDPGRTDTFASQDDVNRDAAALPSTSPTSSSTPSPTATSSSPAPAPTTTKPTKTTPPPVLVGDGIYMVGEDIPAGRYKVTERAGSMCYWERADGDNPDDLIDNSLGGGFPSFRTKKGEQITINNCPEFRKVG